MKEKELGQILTSYHYGYEVLNHKKTDTINLYPSRPSGVRKMSLKLGVRLGDISALELLPYLLSNAEFADWNRRQWEEFL